MLNHPDFYALALCIITPLTLISRTVTSSGILLSSLRNVNT